MSISLKNVAIASGAVVLGATGVIFSSHLAGAITNENNPHQNLVSAIANKFNLKESDVQTVLDQFHKERLAEKQENRLSKLAQLVTEKKLTQTQSDYIKTAWEAIDTTMQSAHGAKETDDSSSRDAVKEKIDTLRAWAIEQELDLAALGIAGPRGGDHAHKSPQQ